MSQTKAQLIDAVDGSIVTADLADDAVNASKLASNAVVSASIVDGSIVNADVNASAAIAGTKISPDFGSQGITTTGVASIGNGLTLTGTNPFIDIVDSNNDSDFTVKNENGTFEIEDKTNSNATRLAIPSSGGVGIGISSTSRTPLHVHEPTSATANIHLTNSTTGSGNTDGLTIYHDGSGSAGIFQRENLPFLIGTNNTERVRVLNDGKVGIGVSDPNVLLHIRGDNNNNELEGLRIQNNNTGGQTKTSIGFTNTTQSDYEHARIVATRDNSGRLDFQVGAQSHTVLCVDGFASGVVGVNTVQASKALDVNGEIRTNTGILFGSDTAAANRLDDFETGTFTPLLSDNLSSGTANSYQNQSGHYTKIGNIVHIIGAIRANDISNLTSSANLKLRGLPFVVSDVTTGSGEPDMLHIPFMNNLTSNSSRGFVYGRMENGVAAANIGKFNNSNQNGSDLLFSEINSGSATFFAFSATYRTGS